MFSKRLVLSQRGCRAAFFGLQNVQRGFATSSGPLLQKTAPLDPGLEMPQCDYEPEQYQGISFEHAKEVRKTYLNPALFSYYKEPVFICKGHMQWLWDSAGKRYLDLFAGIVTVSVGHCHPHVTKAAKDQLDKLWHTTNIYYHPTLHEYAELMASKLPGNLKVCYFVNSGSEANDMAIMMARAHTGNFDFLSLRNAYHGASPYTLGILAHSTWKLNVPVGFGYFQTMNPDVYQGPWGGANCRDSIAQTDRTCNCAAGQCMASKMYVDQLKDVLVHSTSKKVAGFIAEPIQAIDEDGVQKNCEVVGTYFLEELLQLKKEFPDVIGDVRGKGLMIGVEFVTDKESKTPLPPEKFVPIWEDCKDMGVLVGKGGLYGNVMRIKPPMCITKEDVDFGVAVIRTALSKYSHGK
ncbi:hypothetical protein pdam_00008751 [Pocillopora damicornis]|uniref:Alanine--glyoxylate aminotransferase 2, mitochondrial n=1 Tax=Pocillopora damicornis TaxID=46731 RepID=A0A3M6UA91_POCDA|nr:hypothetical protein pdam_00008751 [Pocillopora damicornis]